MLFFLVFRIYVNSKPKFLLSGISHPQKKFIITANLNLNKLISFSIRGDSYFHFYMYYLSRQKEKRFDPTYQSLAEAFLMSASDDQELDKENVALKISQRAAALFSQPICYLGY